MKPIRLVAGAVAGSLLLAACGTDPDEASAESEASESPSIEPTDEPAETPTPEPTEAATPTEEPTVEVPVYFVSFTPSGPRLFAENVAVPEADPLAGAIDALVAGDSSDPDYISPIPPEGGDLEAELQEGLGVVYFENPDWIERVDGMDKSQAKLAAAALVRTIQDVAETEQLPVEAVLGDTTTTLFGQDLRKVSRPANRDRDLGMVNVLSPTDGDVVADTMVVEGVANTFEANVPWTIRRDGELVEEGFATADFAFEFAPWTVEIDVSGYEPGTYVFEASTEDVGEGPPPTLDDKTFVIE